MTSSTADPADLLTVPEAAAALKISRWTVAHHYRKSGRLTAVRNDLGEVRITGESVRRFRQGRETWRM